MHEIPSSTILDAASVGRACRLRPELMAGLGEERLSYSAAVAVAPFAESDDDFAHWFSRALELKVHALRAEIAGEHPTHERPLKKLTDEEVAWLDDAVRIIRDELKREIPYKQALALFVKRAITENQVGKPRLPLITIDHCPDCKRATRRINGGDVPVSDSQLAAAYCDGEVLDLREGTGEVKRTIPRRTRRQTKQRDKERCSIPGCKNRGCHLHHPEGWQNGHSVDRLFSVCYVHHEATHEGDIVAKGDMPNTEFFLRDGTYIGRAGDPVRADLNPGRPGFPPDEETTCDEAVLADAVRALRVMDLDQKSARAVIEGVLRLHPERAWTLDELVREALLSSPSRAAKTG